MIKKITLVAIIALFAIGANAQIKFKGIAVGGALGTKSAITTSGDGMGFGINAMELLVLPIKLMLKQVSIIFSLQKLAKQFLFLEQLNQK